MRGNVSLTVSIPICGRFYLVQELISPFWGEIPNLIWCKFACHKFCVMKHYTNNMNDRYRIATAILPITEKYSWKLILKTLLKNWVVLSIIRPKENSLSPLTDRDLLPDNEQIYSMVLTYQFSLVSSFDSIIVQHFFVLF